MGEGRNEMSNQPKALRIAECLDLVWAGGVAPDAAAELRHLHELNAELLKAAAEAEDVIEILWVSHHAGRADAALEKLRDAIAKANL